MDNTSFPRLKEQALSSLARGDIDAAAMAVNALFDACPDRPEPLYFDGLRALLAGDNAHARQRLEQALEFDPDNINVRINLGVALQRLKEQDAAVTQYQAVLSRAPDNLQAAVNLASSYFEKQDYHKCREVFASVLDKHGENSLCLSGLADAERCLGNWRRATRLYEKAIQLDSENGHAARNLALVHLSLQQYEQVQKLARHAIEKNPDNIDAYVALGRSLAAEEKYEEAMDVYAEAYDRNATHADLIAQIGVNYSVIGDYEEASSWFNKALSIDPGHADAIIGMAQSLDEGEMHERGLALLAEHESALQDRPQFWVTRSDLYWNEGEADEALACLEKAKSLAPQQASLYCKMGGILSSSGRVDQAEQNYVRAFEEQKSCVAAIAGLASIKKGQLDSQYVEGAESMLRREKLADGARSSLNNALSYYYAGKKDYEKAAFHMAEANKYQWLSRTRQGWEYDPEGQRNNIRRLKGLFSSESVARQSGLGHSSTMPIFIVGMPRSGTTLTEQILARHPAVLGVGERNYAATALHAYQSLYAHKHQLSPEQSIRACMASPDAEILQMVAEEYLRLLDDQIKKSGKPDVKYVVDKMPDNYHNVGWIKLLFPRARIIHARRDMRDVAMSCWQTQFGSIRWACHIEHLVARFESYVDMMEHWRTVFPEGFLETDYESLVEDQEAGSRKLIEYIGLPWDDACLTFYESDRLVRTASITQVRQPIYKTSVAKWAPYQEWIPELINPLTELMKSYR